MKEATKKFATTTSFYGLSHIVKAKGRTMKTLLTLMTLLSLSCGLYIIGNTISEYRKYGVITQTKRIHPVSDVFPSVTFCSLNNFTDMKALFTRAEYVSPNGRTNLIGVDFIEGNLDSYKSHNCIKFNNYRHKNGPDLSFSNNTSNDLLEFYINVSSNSLDIFISDNYMNVLDWSQFVTGFGNKTRGTFYIDFTKSVEHRLEEPYNDCRLMEDETYRQANCLAQCRNSRAIAIYNCTLRNYYYSSGYDYCDLKISYQECEEQCPKECKSTKFEAIVTRYEETGSSTDTVNFSIAFKDFSYFKISETPKMNGFSLISNIGGALGLFVGIRFLSMIELLEYLTEIYFVFY